VLHIIQHTSPKHLLEEAKNGLLWQRLWGHWHKEKLLGMLMFLSYKHRYELLRLTVIKKKTRALHLLMICLPAGAKVARCEGWSGSLVATALHHSPHKAQTGAAVDLFSVHSYSYLFRQVQWYCTLASHCNSVKRFSFLSCPKCGLKCTWYKMRFRSSHSHSKAQQAANTVQTLYHRAKISFFALRGDCAHEKYLFILGVRDWKTGIFCVFRSLSGKNSCAGLA